MIADLKPYPEYKESGVSWLGPIPARWSVRRVKLLLREVDSRSSSGKEQLLRVSQYTGVTQRKAIDGSDAPDTRASSLVGYKRVSPDDLVINIMLAWNGSMGVSRHEGIASPAYCVYRFKDGARPWYYHELLRLPLYKGRIKTASTGVVESRLRLYSDALGRIEAIQPPPEEQDAIVRFIDYTNGRLDRAIRAKRKVIALLHEQKQAIIHRAVTRGLDPTVPLKPSGIPWLGDIPQHWNVTKVRRIVESHKQGFYTNEGYVEIGTPLLRITDIKDDSSIHFNTCPKLRVSEAVKKQFGLEVNDFVFVRSGATIGKFGIVQQDTDAIFGSYTIRFRFRRLMWRDFLKWYFKSRAFTDGLLAELHGGAIVNVNAENMKNQSLPIPPEREQKEIDSFLARELRAFEEARWKEEREIALLREYRTRLVADVVTGKLDVRPAARQLPAEPVEQEPASDPQELTEPETEETE